jgi:hypothetical protein
VLVDDDQRLLALDRDRPGLDGRLADRGERRDVTDVSARRRTVAAT